MKYIHSVSVPVVPGRNGQNLPRQLQALCLVGSIASGLLLPGAAQAGSFTSDFSSPPDQAQLFGDPGDGTAGVVADGVLKLTTLVGSMQAAMIVDDLDEGKEVSGFTATFKLLIGGGSGADGFSFSFGGDVNEGGISEEGSGTGLIVAFDSYDNGNGEAPAIDLKIGGVEVATTKISPRSALAANQFLPVRINLDPDGTVDVSYGDKVIYTNLYTAFVPTPGRFAFGARTGGSYDNHWIDDLAITTTTVPQTQPAHPLVVTNSPPASGNSPEAKISLTLQDFATQVKTNSIQLKVNGTVVTPTISKTDKLTLVEFDPPGLFAPESVNTYEVVYSDDGTPAFITTNLFTFKVVAYNNVVLPAPLYLETFNATEEGSLPAGWVATNATTSINPGIDFGDPSSDAYLDWTVVERTRLAGEPFDARRLNVAAGYLNGQPITNLVDERSVYAESDNRGGNQIQMLFTPDFDLTGKSDIYLSYNSIYEQNQDSMGAVEYSVDQGATWKPILIMLDQPDIVLKADGAVDPVATLTTVQTDTPEVDDGTGNLRRTAYGEFLASKDYAAMAPYISARVNDNATESKRVELFRLPAADNQAKVRFRFVQAGTGSWYFGIDNFGLYSIPGQVTGPSANIAWVSFHPADNDPSANAKAAGFTEAPDAGYTKLLAANGHKVTRIVTSGTPDVARLNTFDLVIISRSVPSGDYQDPPETAAWNGIKAPTMLLGGYILRNSRLGYTTGGTIPDTTNASVRLQVKNPAHPIFEGVALDATNLMVNAYANLVSYTNLVQRGLSVNTDPVAGGGTILATIGTAGDPAFGGMVIGEWPAGAKMATAAGDTLGGHRLVFLSGSRELTITSEGAGIFDLTEEGAKMFLNAVNYMTQPVVAAPKFTSITRGADGKITVTWDGGGTLQAAEAVNGPWQDVPGATSPYVLTPDAQMIFGRIKK